MAKLRNLSKFQLRQLARIKAAGSVHGERLDNGEEHFFLDCGQTITTASVRALVAHGLLSPVGDALFAAMTQTYRPT